MIEETLFSHLSANVTSVSGRVYPMIMPQNAVLPAMVYTVVNAKDEQGVSGCVSCTETLFQVDVYAKSYAEAKTIKEEVKSVLYSFDHYPHALSVMDGIDEEIGFFRQIIEFTIRS